jgi:hypothetical protein
MTRFAWRITSASCVEKMKVVPSRLVQLLHQVDDGRAGLAVEVGGRLVGEHDARPGDQGARDGDALALAAGQLVGALDAAAASGPTPVDDGLDPRAARRLCPCRLAASSGNSTF